MPMLDTYIAEVTVSVVLRSSSDGTVAEYSVTRKAHGGSGGGKASNLVATATAAAVAASKSFSAGLDNAEARRLK